MLDKKNYERPKRVKPELNTIHSIESGQLQTSLIDGLFREIHKTYGQ